MHDQWNHKMFNVTGREFNELALQAFKYQYDQNETYKNYVDALGVNVPSIGSLEQIPFLPIRFFKSHSITTGTFESTTVFESSGTTGSINSRHFIKDATLYEESFMRAFEMFYGPVSDWCILGLLPSYLERNNSSLVYMVNRLVHASGHTDSGFFLHDFDDLKHRLHSLEQKGQKTLLVGVTFALLDFAEKHALPLQHTLVMETGGMKGRRRELIRAEVHDRLCEAFSIRSVHSEYGMTELLSQAYSSGHGFFKCPPWMKILLRDEEDPLTIKKGSTSSGVINVIDLANINSCCFIATDDAGRLHTDGSFEVLGRMDNSDLRGCSLMAV